jgi:DNA ligase-1
VNDARTLSIEGADVGRGDMGAERRCAVLVPDDEQYQTICKVGTGFSDAALAELYDSMSKHKIAAPPSYYSYSDVWFNAAQVWEVRAADISMSPVHRAGIGQCDQSRGIALRFPRFVRVRMDKSCDDVRTGHRNVQITICDKVISWILFEKKK